MGIVFADIDISLDGFVAGENISPENPLGTGGERLVWYGDDVNEEETDFEAGYGQVDAKVLRNAMGSEGSVVMGRRTFDLSIASWGDNPPIHRPCFVLTNRALPTLEKSGGTSFTFVTRGPEETIRMARDAAGDRGVCVMGGAQTVRELLMRGLLDEVRLHIVPVLLGSGLPLFDERLASAVSLEKVQALDGERAVHLTLRRRST